MAEWYCTEETSVGFLGLVALQYPLDHLRTTAAFDQAGKGKDGNNLQYRSLPIPLPLLFLLLYPKRTVVKGHLEKGGAKGEKKYVGKFRLCIDINEIKERMRGCWNAGGRQRGRKGTYIWTHGSWEMGKKSYCGFSNKTRLEQGDFFKPSPVAFRQSCFSGRALPDEWGVDTVTSVSGKMRKWTQHDDTLKQFKAWDSWAVFYSKSMPSLLCWWNSLTLSYKMLFIVDAGTQQLFGFVLHGKRAVGHHGFTNFSLADEIENSGNSGNSCLRTGAPRKWAACSSWELTFAELMSTELSPCSRHWVRRAQETCPSSQDREALWPNLSPVQDTFKHGSWSTRTLLLDSSILESPWAPVILLGHTTHFHFSFESLQCSCSVINCEAHTCKIGTEHVYKMLKEEKI